MLEQGKYKECREKLKVWFSGNGGEESFNDALKLSARLNYETGKYDEAIKDSEKIILSDPGNAEAEFIKACAQMVTGDYQSSYETFRKLVNNDPDNNQARIRLIEVAEIIGDKRELRLQMRLARRRYRRGNAKTAAGLTAVARAIQRFDPQSAWRIYQEAHKTDKNYLTAYIEAGYLGYEKYAWSKAETEFRAALKLNPSLPEALTGLGVIKTAGGKYKQALRLLGKALRVNPSFFMALNSRALIFMIEKNFKTAFDELKKSLSINKNNTFTLAIFATYYECKGDSVLRDKQIKRIHRINPSSVDVYNLLATCAGQNYRFRDALKWADKSMEMAPKAWDGYYLAGVNLLRLGEEKKGYKLLNKSFKLNPFNFWAYNMLVVLDKDFLRNELAHFETEHFVVKMDKKESAVIWPYLEPILETTYKKYTGKYQFIPKGAKQYNGRVLVLIMPTHDSFSVRTVGLPGLGAVGVCFGQVIVMPSPGVVRNRGMKEFNWKSTFEHEFMHVLTVQKTNYKIPRWFTEGISVWEEEDNHYLWRKYLSIMIKKGKLLPLKDLETGFTRPENLYMMPVNYYYSNLICQYLNQKYGFKSILDMLEMFKDGKSTVEIVTVVTGKDIDTIEDEIHKFVVEAVKEREKQTDFDKDTVELISDLILEKRKRQQTASKKGEKTRPVPPQADWQILADHYQKNNKQDKAVKILIRRSGEDKSSFDLYKQLGRMYADKKQYNKAVKALQNACYINPYDIDIHLQAAGAYTKLKNYRAVLRECRVVLSLDPENKNAREMVKKYKPEVGDKNE